MGSIAVRPDVEAIGTSAWPDDRRRLPAVGNRECSTPAESHKGPKG
jgi:hypothetical protein